MRSAWVPLVALLIAGAAHAVEAGPPSPVLWSAMLPGDAWGAVRITVSATTHVLFEAHVDGAFGGQPEGAGAATYMLRDRAAWYQEAFYGWVGDDEGLHVEAAPPVGVVAHSYSAPEGRIDLGEDLRVQLEPGTYTFVGIAAQVGGTHSSRFLLRGEAPVAVLASTQGTEAFLLRDHGFDAAAGAVVEQYDPTVGPLVNARALVVARALAAFDHRAFAHLSTYAGQDVLAWEGPSGLHADPTRREYFLSTEAPGAYTFTVVAGAGAYATPILPQAAVSLLAADVELP